MYTIPSNLFNLIHFKGIPFFEDNKKNKNDIPLNCFLSAESIWWCVDHIDGIETEADGMGIRSNANYYMQIFDLNKGTSL